VPNSGKPQEVLVYVLESLRAALAGYALPKPFAVPRLRKLVQTFFSVALDRRLPYLQMKGGFIVICLSAPYSLFFFLFSSSPDYLPS
jgi:hypothetical protein